MTADIIRKRNQLVKILERMIDLYEDTPYMIVIYQYFNAKIEELNRRMVIREVMK